MPTAAIEVLNLDKRFGDIHAVDEASFDVQQGEIFSLLGPNGAGKSTTISMISGLIPADSGDARILGSSISKNGAEAKSHIGIVPQEIALYEDLSARENLEFWGKMYGLRGRELQERVDEVLALIGLSERQKDRVDTYSGGMKRRVNIGAALLHKPAVIIMDEPTVGIDPQSRRHILDGVKQLQAEGATVLYTTHYMEEAQELSDHIAIMDQGQIIANGTHDELVRLVGSQDRIVLQLSAPSAEIVDQWRGVRGVSSAVAENGQITILAADSNVILPRLFEVTNAYEERITAVEIQEPNLESVFLLLTGRALRD
jgi:linearmycin/streptolysin S transport system ATP-binding protein